MPHTAIMAELQQGWRQKGVPKKGGKCDPGLCLPLLSSEKSCNSEPEEISWGLDVAWGRAVLWGEL